MLKKILFLIIVFYILTLFQTSFMPFFDINGLTINLVLVLVILINLFEVPEKKIGLWSAFMAGFFLDVWSSMPFGIEILIFVLVAVFIKFILKKYVQIPTFEKV
ncbi:rod shape-determining protein MreD [Candidatus Parcubacteria bacterium]|nr:rod shape-determining protein MreD [Candidatus Parcubacteria bacterium]